VASLLQLNGASPQKQPVYAPIFMDRSFTGLFTQRAVVHDPADIYTSKYYGGRPDALWAGLNIELTNRLTLSRRPGLSPFTTTGGAGFTYPTAPLTSYPFHLIDGTIRVMVDTAPTGPSESDVLTSVTAGTATATYVGTFANGANNALAGQYITIAGFLTGTNNGKFAVLSSSATQVLVNNALASTETHAATATTNWLTSVAAASGGNTVYTGTISDGASNNLVGLKILISGAQNGVNNGTYTCTASTGTTITLNNPKGVVESGSTITMSCAGGVYWDKQNGTALLIWAKSPGASQTHFIGSGGYLYFGNGVDVKKYTPYNTVTPNSVWNWGIAAASAQPTVNIVSSGSATAKWQKNTIYSTMGFTYDSTNHILWQLISVDANPSNPNVANAQYGTAGPGGVDWNQALYGQTNEPSPSTLQWQNKGQLQEWAMLTVYGDAGFNGTAGVCFVHDITTKAIYANFWGSGSLSRSGNKKPPFSATPGWRYWEQGSNGAGGGGYKAPYWYFFCTDAQAQAWQASHSYLAWYSGHGVYTNAVIEPFILPPPTTGVNGNPPTPVYVQIPLNSTTSGSNNGPFPSSVTSPGQQQTDGQLLWQAIVTLNGSTYDSLWHAHLAMVPWTIPGGSFSAIYDGTNIQVCTGGGTTGAYVPGTAVATAVSITASYSSGITTYTLGSGSWLHTPANGDQVQVSGFTNGGNNGLFQVTGTPTSNSVQLVNTGGVNETATASIVYSPWGTSYNATTVDGTVTWVCVGPQVTWVAGSSTTGIWHLPLSGFSPPQQTQAYGGSTIVGTSNSSVETVTISGESGSTSEPTWNAINQTTSEGPSSPQLTWYNESIASTNSLAFNKGYSYAFSYKARPLDDFYAPPPLGGLNGTQQYPPGLTPAQQTPFSSPPVGSQTNAVSSASPANTKTGSNAGAVLYVSGPYSSDPQVDTIIIWRSTDGGGPYQMFELTEIPNVVGGGTWTFADYLPDAPTTIGGILYPGLNTSIPAPINGVNNPPTADFLPQVYSFERIWGAAGQYVPFSGGPDTAVGNPDEAYFLSDSLPFLAPVTRVAKSAQGLITFLTDSVEVIIGGPATASFSSVTWAPGVGLLDYNYFDQFAGEMYFFSADNQFRVMTPALNITNAGFAIADQFANLPTSGTPSSGITNQVWNPKGGYVASQQSNIDNAIYVADGNFGWYRLNPRQAGALPNTEPVWSPFARITNGARMVMSIETQPGLTKLLIGPNFGGNPILVRDLTVFTDNGTQYDAYFEMGNITLAHPGQLALLKFLEMDFSGVGFQPTVSYLLNEISGTFTPFTAKPVFDPPSLYGATIVPTSYSPNRYYFASNAALARCRHLRIKVDYGTGSTANELFNMTIFGRLMVEL
jgi:hypothetical protein